MQTFSFAPGRISEGGEGAAPHLSLVIEGRRVGGRNFPHVKGIMNNKFAFFFFFFFNYVLNLTPPSQTPEKNPKFALHPIILFLQLCEKSFSALVKTVVVGTLNVTHVGLSLI